MKSTMSIKIRKGLLAGICILLFSLGMKAQSHSYSTDDSMIALEGYSAVSYMDKGKAEQGKRAYKASYDGLTYYFVNQNQLKSFQNNPRKYQPQYGGWCAFAVSLGGKYRPDPESFRVVNGKLYLFTVNPEGDFVKVCEKEGIGKHIAQANKNWQSMKKFKTFAP